jgi:hypothetical protein
LEEEVAKIRTPEGALKIKANLRNPRWVKGRLPELLKRAADGIRLYVRLEPRKPRRKVRRRGHRETSATPFNRLSERRARISAERAGFSELRKEQKVRQAQQSQIELANELLLREALGMPEPSVEDWRNQRSYDEEEFSQSYWPEDTSVLVEADPEDTSQVKTSEALCEENELIPTQDKCSSCPYKRGSLQCAAHSAECRGA